MTETNYQERRKLPRHPIELSVFVSPIKVTNMRLESRIINMSLLGCAIVPVSYEFSLKDKLVLCFRPSKQCNTATTINAQVAHVCSDYIGICYDSLGDDVVTLLQDLLKEAKYF